jgi:hypothetical protein
MNLQDLSNETLLKLAAQFGDLLPTPDDWDPTPEEIQAHDSDKWIVTPMPNKHKVNDELKRRGLKGTKVSPW